MNRVNNNSGQILLTDLLTEFETSIDESNFLPPAAVQRDMPIRGDLPACDQGDATVLPPPGQAPETTAITTDQPFQENITSSQLAGKLHLC